MTETYTTDIKITALPFLEESLSDGSVIRNRSALSRISAKNRISTAEDAYDVSGFADGDKSWIQNIDGNLTTSYQTLEYGLGKSIGDVSVFLVVINEALSTGTPDCIISIDGGSTDVFKLQGIGDFTLLRLNGIDGDQIKLKSSLSTTLAGITTIVRAVGRQFKESNSKYFIVNNGTGPDQVFTVGD
jgi:hypothetical protein